MGTKMTADMIFEYPEAFLKGTIPLLVIMTVFLLICNANAIKREGFRVRHLLGTFFGLTCILCNFIFRRLLFTALIACYFECVFIGTVIMSYAAALNYPDLDNDYLIILGCYIGKKGKLLPLLRARLNRAMRFAWEQEITTGKSICFVPSGGQGSDEVMSEGSAMEMYLLSHSAEENEIIAEKESRNTYENFLFSGKLIEKQKKDAKITYITTNYHVLRSGMIAKKAGLNAEGLASNTKWYYWPNGFIREYIAILNMHKGAQVIAVLICAIISLFRVLKS
jgi:vancomycin permeability regulator SanA